MVLPNRPWLGTPGSWGGATPSVSGDCVPRCRFYLIAPLSRRLWLACFPSLGRWRSRAIRRSSSANIAVPSALGCFYGVLLVILAKTKKYRGVILWVTLPLDVRSARPDWAMFGNGMQDRRRPSTRGGAFAVPKHLLAWQSARFFSDDRHCSLRHFGFAQTHPERVDFRARLGPLCYSHHSRYPVQKKNDRNAVAIKAVIEF